MFLFRFSYLVPISILFLCCVCYSCKKSTIEPQSINSVDVATAFQLNQIIWVNDSLGYIVGGDKYTASVLLTTVDGGHHWNNYTLKDQESKGVYGIGYNGIKAYAVGYDGKWYSPILSDYSWVRHQLPEWKWLHHIVFTHANKAFVTMGDGLSTGKIYQIDTLGTVLKVDSFPYRLADIKFINENVGFVTAYGAIITTKDAGNTWQQLNVKGDFFTSISIVGNALWAVGYNGTIVHSNDVGATWNKLRNGDSPMNAKIRFRYCVFTDAQTGYAVGDKGLLMKTTDGGIHWVSIATHTEQDLMHLAVDSHNTLWVVGSGGTVLHINP
jgi:photosystem II stability/assembly factor-like uncharacterized protein